MPLIKIATDGAPYTVLGTVFIVKLDGTARRFAYHLSPDRKAYHITDIRSGRRFADFSRDQVAAARGDARSVAKRAVQARIDEFGIDKVLSVLSSVPDIN